ncbi:MAG: KH domain-containing protein [Thermodesulfobacteria bacterium]|nr:KH domain-containing protein [Thermodesulfobacteriota bacterium]
MNKTIHAEIKEFEEKTVEKAIEEACRYFGCSKDDLEVEIITRGSTGLFGLGGKKARIKAKPKPEIIEELKDKAEEPREETESASGQEQEAEAKEQSFSQDSAATETKEETRGSSDAPARTEIGKEELRKHLELACKITNDIIAKSGLSGEATVVEQGSKPYVNVSGDDLALIIGKDGQTLDALEYLVNLCLRRQNPDVNYRVMLEAAGYRERRRRNLISLAERLALKVKRTGRSLSLSPMPARERRIVHVALKEFKGIKTHSSGQGANRKVVITPARRRRGAKRSKG